MQMNQICIVFWGTKSRYRYEALRLFQSNLWAIDGNMSCSEHILAAILNMQISHTWVLIGRPHAGIHMKIWDPYNNNCGLQTGKYAVRGIFWLFWRPYWICKWAKFAYYAVDLKQEYILKFETHTIKTVNCRQENMLFGAYCGYSGGLIEYANEPNLHIMW